GGPQIGESDGYAYVISAVDGSILYRQNQVVDAVGSNPYTYTVWADSSDLHIPFDGPQGNDATPLPSGVVDGLDAPYLAPSHITASSLSGVTDPWLPAGATETNG